jgi:putative hemolysin
MFEIVLLVILFVLSAIFSAAETAITSLSRIKVGHLVEKKVPGARLLKELKDKPSQFLSLILFGNNLVNIAAAAIATSIIIRLFESRGWVNLGAAVGLATGVMTFLILVFGEITPKTVAIRNAETIALVMAPVIWVLQIVLSPIVYLLEMVTRPFVFIFGGKATVKGALVTEDEIKYILSASEKEGVIEEEERQMITSVLEFWDTVVREVMTPRPDIVAVEANEPMDNLVKMIIESGHSRIPVYDSNLDNIIGVVYAKELLKNIAGEVRD